MLATSVINVQVEPQLFTSLRARNGPDRDIPLKVLWKLGMKQVMFLSPVDADNLICANAVLAYESMCVFVDVCLKIDYR